MKKLVLLLAFFVCTSVSDARPSKQQAEDSLKKACDDVLALTVMALNADAELTKSAKELLGTHRKYFSLVGDKLFVDSEFWEDLGKETREKIATNFTLHNYCLSGDIYATERILKSLTVVGADSGKILGIVRNSRLTEY